MLGNSKLDVPLAAFRLAKGLLGANPYLVDVQPFTSSIFTKNDTLYKTAPL